MFDDLTDLYQQVILDHSKSPRHFHKLENANRTAQGHNPLPGSVGTYYWTGAWGTTFFVDPHEKMIALQLIQAPFPTGGPYRRSFRNLAYQALTGS